MKFQCYSCGIRTNTEREHLTHTCQTGATKHDQEKPQISLIPFEFTEGIAKILTFGAKKYGKNNWCSGFSFSRLLDAAYRHIGSFQSGIDNDTDTGESHILHAACCLMFLYMHQKFNLGTDDRFIFKNNGDK